MRRRRAEKRIIVPDMRYNSALLAKFINKIMRSGNKALAENIVYSAFNKIQIKYKVDPFETFKRAMDNTKPYVKVISVRVGGANYQVPSEINEHSGYDLAMRWLIESSLKRSDKTMIDKLSEELWDAANSRGGAIKKKEDTHRMAEANKAFSHLSPKKMVR